MKMSESSDHYRLSKRDSIQAFRTTGPHQSFLVDLEEEKNSHLYESTEGGSCPIVELSMIELFQ
jgi:hypothetical protein